MSNDARAELNAITNPETGRRVWCATRHGVAICWQCFEPFGDRTDRELALQEKFCGEIPIGVHRKCWNGPPPRVAMPDLMAAAERAGARTGEFLQRKMGLTRPGRGRWAT